MKVSLLVPMLGAGGAERITIEIARGLKDMVDVDIVVNEITGEFVEDAASVAQLHDLGGYNHLRVLRNLHRYIVSRRPDVIIAQGTRMAVYSSLALALPGHKPRLVWCLHNPFSTKQALYPRPVAQMLTLLVSRLANKADRIVAVSDGLAKNFLDLVGSRFSDRLMTIYNPVPLYVPGRTKAARLSQQTIVAAGRLEKQKAFDVLISAMPLVIRQCDAKLMIYGIGSQQEALANMISELGLTSRVFLAGFHRDLRQRIAEADVFVLSSQWEGLPTALIEAMGTGVPVVSTDCVSGPAEILENGKWGKLVPVGDAAGLAAAIVDTLRNGGVDPTERAAAFAPEKSMQKYRELIEQLTSGN